MAKRVYLSQNSAREVSRTVRKTRGRPENNLPMRRHGGGTSYKFMRLFELEDALVEGGTATAWLVRWVEDEFVTSTDPTEQFEVVDFIGSMAGPSGTRGIAFNMFGQWVATQLACA